MPTESLHMGATIEKRFLEEVAKVVNSDSTTSGDSALQDARIRTLQHAFDAIMNATDHLNALNQCSEMQLKHRVDEQQNHMDLFLRYMILKDILFKTSDPSYAHSSLPTER